MVSLIQRWEQVHAAVAELATPLGINPQDIVIGNWQLDTEVRVPGIVVYLSPGDDLFADSPPPDTIATCRIFCLARNRDIPHATSQATDYGWAVVDRIRHLSVEEKVMVRWATPKVVLDTVQAEYAATVIRFCIYYG